MEGTDTNVRRDGDLTTVTRTYGRESLCEQGVRTELK